SNVEKVVAELQWPANEGERVDDRTRPKNEDHAQAGDNIQKRTPMPHRHERAGIVRKEEKCDPLYDTDESQLNIDDDRIELAAAVAWWIHDATRNRSMIKLSRR